MTDPAIQDDQTQVPPADQGAAHPGDPLVIEGRDVAGHHQKDPATFGDLKQNAVNRWRVTDA